MRLNFTNALTLILLCMSFPSYAQLTFTFNANDQSSRPGEGVQVEWVVTNTGNSQENNVFVELPFPAPGFNNLSVSLTDGGACPSITCDFGETIVWTLGNMAPGESRVASFPLIVSTNAANGTTNIEARLLQGTSLVATSGWGHQVEVLQNAELSIDSSKALVAPGETFSIGFLAGNRGTDALSSATLTVPVPSQLAIVSAPGGTVSGSTVTWNLGNLPSGRVTKRVVNVRVRSNVDTGELLVLDDAVLAGTIFGLPQSTAADHVITVGDSPLEFHIKTQETLLRPGETHNVEIVVSNASNQIVQNASVSFLYPYNLASVSESNLLGGDCASITCDSGERMSWSLGNVLPGETIQLRFRTWASNNFPTGVPVRWQGRLTVGSELVAREYLATGNSAVDVNLQIDADEAQVAAGDEYHYTFYIGNTGVDSIASAQLTVPTPNGVTVLETFGGTLSGDTVTWSLNDLASGAVAQRTLRVRADNGLPNGSIINLIDAEVSATVFGIPQATMAQHVLSLGEVSLDMEVRLQQGVAQRGESVLVEIVVSNNGTQVQQNVIGGLLFPDDINSASLSNLEGTTCPSITCDTGEQIFVAFGNLVPGETKSVAHSVVVSNNAFLGEHTAWIGNVFSDNSISRRVESMLGISSTGLELQASSEQLLIDAGNTIVYQFASGNTAGFVAGNAQLIVPLPAAVSVVNAPGGQVVDDRVIYNLGDIEDEEIILRELTVNVNGSAGAQIVLENIELSAEFFGVEQMVYGGHVVTVGSSPLTGTISVQPTDPQPGDSVEVTIDIQNDSSQVQQNVAARLRYPAGVNSVSESLSDGGVCPSITCDSGEDIVWSLGTLVPGGTASISFLTTISNNEPAGGMIEWPARIQAGTINQRRIEATSLVGNVVAGPSAPPAAFCNGLAVTVDLANGDQPGSGDDVIMGTSGADFIDSGAGDDTICAMEGADTILAGGGVDYVEGGNGADLIFGEGGNDIIFGGPGGDEIDGGGGDDEIFGEAGSDTLVGRTGEDILDGGTGVDSISGGPQADTIFTGSGATVGTGLFVTGGGAADTIFGGPDADDLRGAAGADTIRGEGGDDVITGGIGQDELFGGDGDDTIRGQGSRDDLFGEAGDDDLFGGAGDDDLDGGSGLDSCAGQAGTNDTAVSCESESTVP